MAGYLGLIIIAANVFFSYRGFREAWFFEKYCFEVEQILVYKRYIRMISSGFLHLDWIHLLFNMLSLYAFTAVIELGVGELNFLLIYIVSLLGGNFFSLYMHRHNPHYSAAGASGAVCGIIFATIALFPGMYISLLWIPIPSWLYGLAFILYTTYGIRKGSDNTGHAAHLGGALVGMAVAILLQPSVLVDNYPAILCVSIPAVLFIYFLSRRQGNIPFLTYRSSRPRAKVLSIDQKYNLQKKDTQAEVDRILDKVHRKGIESLTREEKSKLERYSKSK